MKQKQIIVGLGILVNVKNEVLITQRYDPGNEKTHMKWQVPGGKVEFGETVKEAVVREMKEEVMVDVAIPDYPPMIYSSVWKHPNVYVQCLLIGYICTAHGQKVKIGCEETAEFRWIKPNDILKLDRLPKRKEFVQDVEKLMVQ